MPTDALSVPSGLPLIILGGGGHAAVVLDLAELVGAHVLGIVALDPPTCDAPYLGTEMPADPGPDRVLLVNAVGSVDVPHVRARVFSDAVARGYRFATLRHPSAVVARSVTIGQGGQVHAGCVVQTRTALGENVILNTGSRVDHDCVIDDHVHIAPGVTLSGGCHIGAGTHIGVGAVVIQGVRIGPGALVAAGAVVIRDVPSGARIAGVPARALQGD